MEKPLASGHLPKKGTRPKRYTILSPTSEKEEPSLSQNLDQRAKSSSSMSSTTELITEERLANRLNPCRKPYEGVSKKDKHFGKFISDSKPPVSS